MDRIIDQTDYDYGVEFETKKVLDSLYHLHQNIGYGLYAK